MKKIIQITDTTVFVGNEDGSYTEHSLSEFDFPISIGDEIQIFTNNEELLIVPVNEIQKYDTTRARVKKNNNTLILVIIGGVVTIATVLILFFTLYRSDVNLTSILGSSTLEKSIRTPSIPHNEDLSKYTENIDYDKWNHDEYNEGYKIKIKGQVLDVHHDEKGTGFRLAMDGDFNKDLMVYVDKKYYKSTVAENDILTIYGLTKGRTTYETVQGGERTIPIMEGLFYERAHSEVAEQNFTKENLYSQKGIIFERIGNGKFKLTNYTGKELNFSVESIDADGQVLNSFLLSDLDEKLSSGQHKIAEFTSWGDTEALKSGTTVTIEIKARESFTDIYDTFKVSFKLNKDI